MNAVHRVLDPAAGRQVPPRHCALGVMTKVPRAGRVKTRLTPPLTPEEAAALNTCFLRDTASAIELAASDGIARGIGVYTPIGEESAYRGILPGSFELIPQRGDAFGERLTNAAEDLFAVGFDSVCLIDSDSPTVPQRAFCDAARLLSQAGDCIVFGPSDDGGYYLVGMKRLHRRAFEEIDWSTERVAEQTLERAREIGVAVELLPTWYDVDDRATLRRLCDELLGDTASTGFAALQTRNFLHGIISREGRERIWPL
ncbi:MAG TPA: TIGR04282 family arsenosugar biosynthesis glycosyltransferase [Chthoniobacterales bacterium]|nr:TIGR04282 family arsenosugar biosynthesis glycosyltransferase [Chthoniobacterales bacterium]